MGPRSSWEDSSPEYGKIQHTDLPWNTDDLRQEGSLRSQQQRAAHHPSLSPSRPSEGVPGLPGVSQWGLSWMEGSGKKSRGIGCVGVKEGPHKGKRGQPQATAAEAGAGGVRKGPGGDPPVTGGMRKRQGGSQVGGVGLEGQAGSGRSSLEGWGAPGGGPGAGSSHLHPRET